jgi:hypothetical protein
MKVQEIVKNEKKRYPFVFVISDGAGNRFSCEKPEKWHWFLTHRDTYCIPNGSNIYDLKDFE